jgi:hypothetical protein
MRLPVASKRTREFHKTAAADDEDAYEQECDVMRHAHPDMTESSAARKAIA